MNNYSNTKGNLIQDKSYAFALEIISICRSIQNTHKEFVISKQLLRSGTSVGANIEEGLNAPTKKDFVHKLSISLKEARESHYWLRLLKDSNIENGENINDLLDKLNEIIALLTAIIKTTRKNLTVY